MSIFHDINSKYFTLQIFNFNLILVYFIFIFILFFIFLSFIFFASFPSAGLLPRVHKLRARLPYQLGRVIPGPRIQPLSPATCGQIPPAGCESPANLLVGWQISWAKIPFMAKWIQGLCSKQMMLIFQHLAEFLVSFFLNFLLFLHFHLMFSY